MMLSPDKQNDRSKKHKEKNDTQTIMVPLLLLFFFPSALLRELGSSVLGPFHMINIFDVIISQRINKLLLIYNIILAPNTFLSSVKGHFTFIVLLVPFYCVKTNTIILLQVILKKIFLLWVGIKDGWCRYYFL